MPDTKPNRPTPEQLDERYGALLGAAWDASKAHAADNEAVKAAATDEVKARLAELGLGSPSDPKELNELLGYALSYGILNRDAKDEEGNRVPAGIIYSILNAVQVPGDKKQAFEAVLGNRYHTARALRAAEAKLDAEVRFSHGGLDWTVRNLRAKAQELRDNPVETTVEETPVAGFASAKAAKAKAEREASEPDRIEELADKVHQIRVRVFGEPRPEGERRGYREFRGGLTDGQKDMLNGVHPDRVKPARRSRSRRSDGDETEIEA